MRERPQWVDAVQLCIQCRGTLMWSEVRDMFICRRCDTHQTATQVQYFRPNQEMAKNG